MRRRFSQAPRYLCLCSWDGCSRMQASLGACQMASFRDTAIAVASHAEKTLQPGQVPEKQRYQNPRSCRPAERRRLPALGTSPIMANLAAGTHPTILSFGLLDGTARLWLVIGDIWIADIWIGDIWLAVSTCDGHGSTCTNSLFAMCRARCSVALRLLVLRQLCDQRLPNKEQRTFRFLLPSARIDRSFPWSKLRRKSGYLLALQMM